ncbi:hypothetical protein [Actinoplanes regularis]|uniref:Uncharacterized protein n=1 Tax=Actinoplanes regularis TaxID=52697 RepID=A0A239JIK0_9ACTN|nr:hypothetical protein [Actinoplanes regularis]GIE91992.1 hypothetical protein Are01nite_84720 [Actinoplanes regularis]SNT04564.1 hypothetical protein SAMN06264365_13511 [Actinoplanes regularis]
MRLSVGYLSPEEIDEGITRLVAFIDAETSRHRGRPATSRRGVRQAVRGAVQATNYP